MLIDLFSDSLARRKNVFTLMDPRIKLVYVFSVIILIVTSTGMKGPLLIGLLSLVFLLGIRVPLVMIIFRMVPAVSIAIVVCLLQAFLRGETVIFVFHVLKWNIPLFYEGFVSGGLILSKVIGAVSVIIFLTMTTPMSEILMAARFFKVPQTFIEIALLSYRYIFVLMEEIVTIINAQRTRLGYSSMKKSMRSIAALSGASVVKTFDQSMATFNAMLLRGYSGGRIKFQFNANRDGKNNLVGVSIFALVIFSFVLTRILS